MASDRTPRTGSDTRVVAEVDSAHAWLILAACWLAAGMTAFCYVNGLYNVALLAEFGQSHALTSACLALQIGLSNITGVLGSLVIQRYGAWLSMFIAGLLVALGFLATSFATSFWQVFLAYGVASGTGFGFGYTTAVITVGLHFDRYRNIACAIASSGVSVGTMVFAPLVEKLIDWYTWRGSLIVLAALFANYFAVSLLLKPSRVKRPFNEYVVGEEEEKRNGEDVELKSYTSLDVKKDVKESENSTNCVREDVAALKSEFQINETDNNNTKCSDQLENGIQKDNAFQQTLQKYRATSKSIYMEQTQKPTTDYWYLNAKYIAVVTHIFVGCFGLSCIYVHFPAYVISLGTTSERASLMVSAMGFGDILSRLTLGLITNIWKKALPIVYVLASAFAGIIGLLGPPMCQHVIGQLVFGILFMSLGNSIFSLLAPMCVYAAGVKNLNFALGVASLSAGLGLLLGPPVTGWLFDITGSYIYTFVLTGLCYLFGSTVSTAAFIFDSCTRRKV